MASPSPEDTAPSFAKRPRLESYDTEGGSPVSEKSFLGPVLRHRSISGARGCESDFLDSGISTDGTPPSCEDSQESFPIPRVDPTEIESIGSGPANEDLDSLPVDELFGAQQDGAAERLSDPPSSDPAEPSSGLPADDEDDDDRMSTISGLSDMSGQDWKPTAGPFGWVQRQMASGADPRQLLLGMLAPGTTIPADLDQLTLWKIIINLLNEPPKRTKLANVNTIDDVVGLIKGSKRIVVLTGAGVSVSCGIPDFRSRNGVYARLAKDFPDLPDPQAMFDIHYFRKDPRPFFKFAKEIYPGQFKPSPCHQFIRCIEKHGKLLRNYTQNIDTLEQVVGISNVVQCHGSFATATCTKCGFKCSAKEIEEDIFSQKIPLCPHCTSVSETPIVFPWETSTQQQTDSAPLPPPPLSEEQIPGIMKPDIVFFGESLGDQFHDSVAKDKDCVDLLIMIGSSLKVRPVALIPSSIPASVPQILINREPLPHLTPDVELLGDCDGIVNQICLRLGSGWEDPLHTSELSETQTLAEPELEEPSIPMLDQKPSENGLEGRLKEGQSSSEGQTSTEGQSSSECQTSTEGQTSTEELPTSQPSGSAQLAKRECIAERLPAGTYYYSGGHRYVFPGAEVSTADDSSDSEDSSDGGDGDESDDEDSGSEVKPYEGTSGGPCEALVEPESSMSGPYQVVAGPVEPCEVVAGPSSAAKEGLVNVGLSNIDNVSNDVTNTGVSEEANSSGITE